MREFETQHRRLFCLGSVDLKRREVPGFEDEADVISDEERFAFVRLVESLRIRGAVVEIIPRGITEDASFDLNLDVIRVHENDFFDIYEEAIHRAQIKIFERLGFNRENIGTSQILHLAAEIGASSSVAKITEQRLQPIEAKIIRGEKLDGIEAMMAIRLPTIAMFEHEMLRDYQEWLFDELKTVGKDGLEKYKQLFEHPLFTGNKGIITQVRSGLRHPLYIPDHNPIP